MCHKPVGGLVLDSVRQGEDGLPPIGLYCLFSFAVSESEYFIEISDIFEAQSAWC